MEKNKIAMIRMVNECTYENEIVENFWEEIEDEKVQANYKSIVNTLADAFNCAKNFICLVIDNEIPSDLLQIMRQLFSNNVRVYILTNKIYPIYAETIVGYSLIRYSGRILGTMVLIDPINDNGFGYLTNSLALGLDNKQHDLLKIDKEELEEAYQYFSWNYWKIAEYEVKNKQDVDKFIKVLESPYDFFPLLDPKYIFYNSQMKSYLTEKLISLINSAKDEIICSIDVINQFFTNILIDKLKSEVKVIVFTNLKKNHMSYIKDITQNGGEVYAYPENGNNFVIVDDKMGLLYVNDSVEDNFNAKLKEHFGIYLQASDVKKLRDNIMNTYYKWQFYSTKKLGDIQAKRIYLDEQVKNYEEEKVSVVLKSSKIDLGNIEAANLRDLFEEKTQPLFKHNELTKKAEYTWTISPKIREITDHEDPLYQKWKDETAKLKNYVNYLINNTDNFDEKEKSLTEKTFSKMKFFLLGKKQKTKEIVQELKELLNELDKKYIDKNFFTSIIKRIESITDQIDTNKRDIDREIDRTTQELQWIEKKEQLNKELDSLKEQESECINKKDNLKNYFKNKEKDALEEINSYKFYILKLEEQVKNLEKDNVDLNEKQNRKENNDQIISILEIAIEKQQDKRLSKNQRSNAFKSTLKELKKCDIDPKNIDKFNNETKIEVLSKILTQQREIAFTLEFSEKDLEVIKTKNLLEEEIKDFKDKIQNKDKDIDALKSKFWTDEDKIEKRLDFLNEEMKIKEDQLKKHGTKFKYQHFESVQSDEALESVIKQNKSKKKQKDGTTKYKGDIPKEDLPKIGKLYRSKENHRKLAIIYWKDLTVGEEEAKRLNAELVCEREEDC